MKIDSNFWCGTEKSLESYLATEKQMASDDTGKLRADYYGQSDEPSGAPTPRLFSKVGEIGVITVAGSLVNSDSWVNEFYGRTGYPEIRDALVHAANDPTVHAILLDVKSGGGQVSGVSDTADLIKQVDKKVKPVHTFSDGMMASAAYWLGSSARTVTVGSVAEIGSIGVISVHTEASKAMEMSGVKATVMKAGTHKGNGNPYEPLSASAKQDLQGQLDYLYEIFVQAVADNREASYQVADQKMAQGKLFIGKQAVESGLADSVSTFDAVISKLTQGIDKAKQSPQYGVNFSKQGTSQMKVALTEQQIAALAESGTPAAETPAAVTETPAPAPAADAQAPAPKEADTSLTEFLKSSLAEAQKTVVSLNVQLTEAKAANEKITATHAALRSIAVTSVDRLKVALGNSAGGADALQDDALLAEHASLRAQFESKFKAGGVAAVSSSGSSDKESETIDPIRQARLASTRFAK